MQHAMEKKCMTSMESYYNYNNIKSHLSILNGGKIYIKFI